MGCFEGILLVSDYDGTLAAHDGTIPENVRSAVSDFIAGGGVFTVSTGRTLQGFHAYDPTLINAPVLLANGGMLYDYRSGSVVELYGIGSDCVPCIRELRDRFSDVSIELYATGETFCINANEASRRHFAAQGIVYREVDDPMYAAYPCAKLMLCGTPCDIAAAQGFFRSSDYPIGFVPTDGSFLELLRPGVNKGTSLLRLAERLGIAAEGICAVGDGYNDVDMLTVAAQSFVPANGDAAAHSAAMHEVCSNNDGAVAEVICRLRRQADIALFQSDSGAIQRWRSENKPSADAPAQITLSWDHLQF